MKCAGLLALVLLSVVVIKTKAGQMRSVCILIPAYDREEMEEGENEEEEVTGWGPGPTGGSAFKGQHVPLVTHHEGEADAGGGGGGGEGGPPPPFPGSAGHSGMGGVSEAALRNPAKRPGPNPKWGHWEWDSDSWRWKIEDDRRRKRRWAAGHVLSGKLQCRAGSVIHVDKVMLGFSIDNRCRPVRNGCQMTSSIGRQVAHCEGRSGDCGVSILQKYMQHCGRRTNYARVVYECIQESEQHNICQAQSFRSTGSFVLSSPSFIAGSVGRAASAQYLSCECEVNRDSNEAVALPWMRTRMEEGKDGACGEELLLLDAWDDKTNGFKLQEELCGVKSLRDREWTSSVLKLSYIPSSAQNASTGFLLRLQGRPDPKVPLQVSCSVVPADGGPSPGAAGPPPTPPSPGAEAAASASASSGDKASAPKLPPNFNFKNYPGLFNKTIAAWRRRLNERKQQQQQQQQPQQEGSAASQVGGPQQDGSVVQPGSAGAVVQTGSEPSGEEFNVTGTSGTLSAVVASLSSIIVIMGSLGIYMWYRRSQQKKKKQMIYYDSRSTVRSDAPIYTEPTYQDPSDPRSGISTSPPTTLAPVVEAADHPTTKQNQQKSSESLQKTPNLKPDGMNPPALPVRPPRRPKEKVRRLPSEEDVAYDNNAGVVGDVKVVLDEDYASLDEISNALGSQDGEAPVVQTEA